ncbi:uncharacterized protein LOC135686340 [Rhopilema esculentum]|uniref:uncharacterized protein LOC135686340 n=1 Tax=Rhopilema esculentum TaxID=499914 RepID=UPI0031D0FF13|eukprot:gene522-10204_t
MSLRRIKRNTSSLLARRSRSDFTITTERMQNVESGYEEMNYEVSRSDIAEDLRSIGNKYDKLVLKMFSQRSHLRGDLMLLKKDAKLLRNEMKYLIVKHDNTTAFKKGFGSESHEKERVLKAEIVTKEMGQLELALADLMSKYYFLLQQTNTLKEINSLWHIRSVLKSDFFLVKAQAAKSGVASIRDSIVRKDAKEVKNENENLAQKLRWLTKLGHEFHEELSELKAARAALVNGRTYLGREYNNNSAADVTQESIPLKMDIDAISKDVRQAEVRIIDSLQERIDALDRLSDAFKLVMIKGGFVSVQDLEHIQVDSTPTSASVSKEGHEISSFCRITANQTGVLHDLKQFSVDSDEEVEEVQVRYIRQEDIDDTDLRCLSLGERKRYEKESAGKQSFYGGLDKSASSRMIHKSKQSKQKLLDVVKTQSSGYESIKTEEVNKYSFHAALSESEEFFDAEESFTSAVTVWLRPEACVLSRTESEETLTDEINNIKESEEEICNAIERKFEEEIGEDQGQDQRSLLSRFCLSKDHDGLSYVSSSSEENLEEKGVNITSTDCKDHHERFFMAKSFFETNFDTKDNIHFVQSDETAEISKTEAETGDVSNNFKNKITVGDEIIVKGPPETAKGKEILGTICLNPTVLTTGLTEPTPRDKILNPEDRPVFYDPAGVWKGIIKKPSNPEKKLFKSNTLERKPKQKVDEQSSSVAEKRDVSNRVVSRNKTLPRGFKSTKKADEGADVGAVIPRRPSATKMAYSDTCSSLPRSQKLLKSQKPVSHAPRVNPEPVSNVSNESPKQTLQKRSTTRPVSQVVSSRASSNLKSNLPVTESAGRPQSRTGSYQQNRPLSRTGSMRKRENEPSTGASPRRPASRGSVCLENLADDSRPASRTGTSRQGRVSIYGTLPRVRKGSKPINSQNTSYEKESESKNSTKPVFDASMSSTKETQNSETLHTVVRPCKSSEELQMIPQLQYDNHEARFFTEPGNSSHQGKSCSTLPRPRINNTTDKNKNEIRVPAETTKSGSDTLKKRKILSSITKKQKTAGDQEQSGKPIKLESEKKNKKKVSEKAAIFMHNALRFVSSDSKSKTKSSNRNINNQNTDTQVKRRPQSVGNYQEHRKSFIPLPSFS